MSYPCVSDCRARDTSVKFHELAVVDARAQADDVVANLTEQSSYELHDPVAFLGEVD